MTERRDSHLIAASRVKGTVVFNGTGEKLGTVEDVMIDKASGSVAFALMSFGGFLGIGTKLHPLPWNVLRYDPGAGGYVVSLDRKTLIEAPTVERDADFDWADESWARNLYDYYKKPGA